LADCSSSSCIPLTSSTSMCADAWSDLMLGVPPRCIRYCCTCSTVGNKVRRPLSRFPQPC
jgi:hypothetical protein